MIFRTVIGTVLITMLLGSRTFLQRADPCEEAKAGITATNLFVQDSLFNAGLVNIKNTFILDMHEHCISFGKDAANNIISSIISNGSATSGKVPAITNAFADLHNHPNNQPPDAGDLYGLMDINKKNSGYKTRFVVTTGGTLYALLITNATNVLSFTIKYPRQQPAFAGGPPGFAVAITDEAREMKYQHHCTDEMVLAFILEKYNTGVSLLKRDSNRVFRKIITSVSKDGDHTFYHIEDCQ